MRARAIVIAAIFGGFAVMCANSTNVRVEQAAEYSPTPGARVSIFGVFHDGRMSEPAWTSLAPKISAALGRTSCELGYGQQLREAKPELAATIEHDVRENGVDDAILERIAPNAAGEYIMLLMSYRQIPHARDGGASPHPQQAAGSPMGAGGRGMGRSQFTGGPRYVPNEEEHVFELSASLFSTRLHKLVAQIDLRYTGDNLDEAMDAFSTKLRALVPDSRCVGWNWGEADPGDAGTAADLDAMPDASL